jgi:pyridoxal phosphate enzyme (YggS family)
MIKENIQALLEEIPENVQLVAVSKTKPNQDILEALTANQLHFGENKVQELEQKFKDLSKEIKWHMIGHLQTNKVKYIVDFVHLIHGVDKPKLLKEINKRAENIKKKVDVLLQIHIAKEETKFGFSEEEIHEFLLEDFHKTYPWINLKGLMGMATYTENQKQVAKEFNLLRKIFDQYNNKIEGFDILSMGMTNDYKIAINEGSTMIRVGSGIFGERNYNNGN